jgi:pilus assembly protein Flp/PilA
MKNLSEYFLCLYLKLTGVLRSDRGQTLVEYALLLVLIAIVVYLMVKGTGLKVNSAFSTINNQLFQ